MPGGPKLSGDIEICYVKSDKVELSGKEHRMSDSDQDDVVFLSPDSSPEKENQGASPVLGLRRSSRKRKSTTGPQCEMTKDSSSKKKKSSPKQPSPKANSEGKQQEQNIPRVPHTPVGQETPKGQAEEVVKPPEPQTAATNIEAILLGMESRLSNKIEEVARAAGEAVTLSKQTNDALGDLEAKVDENEARIRTALAEAEGRIMESVSKQVKTMVLDQLRDAGFDLELSAGGLETLTTTRATGSVMELSGRPSANFGDRSYATAVARAGNKESTMIADTRSVQERREERFWECRMSLRLWPVQGATRESLCGYLTDKLRMDEAFVRDDLGEVKIRKHLDPRGNKHEVYVTFETKEIRDAIKAKAHHLADHPDTAGMRLHLPNFLQKDF